MKVNPHAYRRVPGSMMDNVPVSQSLVISAIWQSGKALAVIIPGIIGSTPVSYYLPWNVSSCEEPASLINSAMK